MVDLFNSFNVIIEGASQVDTGLSPDNGKGRVLFEPKEDTHLMTTILNEGKIQTGPSGAFQVTTLNNYPLKMGMGVIVNNQFEPIIWVARDDDGSLFVLSKEYEELMRTKIIASLPMKSEVNTLSLTYENNVYRVWINNEFQQPLTSTFIFPDLKPVFFVEFDTILKAAFIGNPNRPSNKRNDITERPNYFIKDYNA